MSNMNLEGIEKEIEYTFKNKELLKTALTHTSYAYEKHQESNEKFKCKIFNNYNYIFNIRNFAGVFKRAAASV